MGALMLLVDRKIPESHAGDVARAIKILQKTGCSEVYIFGSLARGESGPHSDIDIAVKGLPAALFYKTGAAMLMELEHPFDLVSLDDAGSFRSFLESHEVFIRVV